MLSRLQRPLRAQTQAVLSRAASRPTVIAFSRSLIASPVRSFADNSKSVSRRSRPAVFGFNGKVAEALYEDAQEKGQVEKVGEELRSFQEVFDGDKEFQMELTSPLIRGDQYLPLLQELFPELGVETDAAKDLITELVTTSSAGRLKKILDDYDRLAQFNRRQVKARVTSAQPLTSEQVERLRGVLQKQIEGDETLELEQEVDESLLGGLRVDMNDRSIDLSVSQRLGELDRALRAS